MRYFVSYDGEACAIERNAPNSGDVLTTGLTEAQADAIVQELGLFRDALLAVGGSHIYNTDYCESTEFVLARTLVPVDSLWPPAEVTE